MLQLSSFAMPAHRYEILGPGGPQRSAMVTRASDIEINFGLAPTTKKAGHLDPLLLVRYV